MTTQQIIREKCAEKGISVTELEKILGFSNGSLTKSGTKSINSDRLYAIAKYFDVPMEYFMIGNEESIQIPFKASQEEIMLIEQWRDADEATKRMIVEMLIFFKKRNSDN